jgi:hypothetical protein
MTRIYETNPLEQRGANRFMILVPFFDLRFLNELAANAAGSFKLAALARNQRSMPPN